MYALCSLSADPLLNFICTHSGGWDWGEHPWYTLPGLGRCSRKEEAAVGWAQLQAISVIELLDNVHRRHPSGRHLCVFQQDAPITWSVLFFRNEKISPKRKFWGGYPCGHPAENFGQASKSWKKKHFGTDIPRGRPWKNFGLKNFGLIFRSLFFSQTSEEFQKPHPLLVAKKVRQYTSNLYGSMPPICIAGPSWLLSLQARETQQYASHLYGGTPPICIEKILGVGVTGKFLKTCPEERQKSAHHTTSWSL